TLEKECRKLTIFINNVEERMRVFPKTKPAHFHLAAAVNAWMEGAEFHELVRHTDIDEGIIIRYFRMVIQLLRELRNDSAASPEFKSALLDAARAMNRDIVDAERLLRSG
ncbi:MAG: hypothetical protein HQL11_06720, partial [Candidatus Omnitrophica bacterium]|nr:hypothetical protein [Candidatus Omnitrophota bacterium]